MAVGDQVASRTHRDRGLARRRFARDAVYGKWDEKYGGFYTQDEMRDLIRYAAVRNVEIIPELDLPGHSRNFARVHPEILCDYTPDLASDGRLRLPLVWCASREENYRLLADILGELAALFPSEYLHIGGDEVDMSQWEKCPNCRALMVREGMADGHALEQYFLGRLTRILEANGQASRRVERGDRGWGAGPQHPCPRLGERQGLPRCHGGGLPYGGDARPVFLFRHAPVAP